MAENSAIEWCHHTFNSWTGCTKVSPACDHCYAESWAKRSGHVEWGPHGSRRRTKTWGDPVKWNRQAEAEGVRRRVFCASLADVFDNHRSIEPAWRADLWALIMSTPHLDWLLLTKRPQNIARYLPNDSKAPWYRPWNFKWPLENVWLGTTVENQEEADRRIPHLLSVPAKLHFLSCEPLLGPVDLTPWLPGSFECAEECGWRAGTAPPEEVCHHCGWVGTNAGEFCSKCGHQDFGAICPTCEANAVQHHPDTRNIGWVITGGENSPHYRPADPDSFRSLRDQCAEASVPFLFKQWEGANQKIIKAKGRALDGVVHDGYPQGRA